MSDHDAKADAFVAFFVKPMLLVIAWFASWNLGTIQIVLGCISALALIGYTLTNWWVLWRDKVVGYRKPTGKRKTGD